jgi:hypothetical protein
MTIERDAIYRGGAIYPAVPLELPENTPVRVRIMPAASDFFPDPFPTNREEVLAIRPKSPPFTADELQRLIDTYGVEIGSLPEDFSRADIYSDHD